MDSSAGHPLFPAANKSGSHFAVLVAFQIQFSKEPRAIILAMFDAILFVRIGERAIILKTGELKTFATELASAS